MMSDQGYPRPPKRETIMQRRLRKARGKAVDDELEDEREREDTGFPHHKGPEGYPHPTHPYSPLYDYPLLEQPSGRGCLSTLAPMSLGAVIVLLLTTLFHTTISQIGTFIGHAIPSLAGLNASLPITVNRSAMVIEQVRQLSRIETTSYQMQTIIEAGTEGNAFQNLLFGDRMLLIAHGTVIAGMDLSTIGPNDVIIDEHRNITIYAPPPQIFSVSLDSERTRVYDRQQGWLASADKDLETRARQQAEVEILREACAAGLMQRATDDGKRVLEQMLRMLEFHTVQVISAPPPACPEAQPKS